MFINPTHPKRSRAGFSLVELLLVMALLPIVFYTVFSNFSVGMRVWKSVNTPTPIEDLEIFYHKMRTDLENTFLYQTVPFEGSSEEVSFATFLSTVPELGGEHGIGQVRLYYDPNLKAIIRQAKNISELYKEHEGKKTVLLREVGAFQLSYYIYDDADKTYTWADAWKADPKKLPVAIQIQYTHKGSQIQTKSYFLPTGG